VAVTSAQIKAEFPEFLNADSGLIDAKIADATGLLDETAWGAKFDQAVKYMACHLLALSPKGETMRLRPDREPEGATTLYERRYLELKRTIPGLMVA
jgi:hypothetical protein